MILDSCSNTRPCERSPGSLGASGPARLRPWYAMTHRGPDLCLCLVIACVRRVAGVSAADQPEMARLLDCVVKRRQRSTCSHVHRLVVPCAHAQDLSRRRSPVTSSALILTETVRDRSEARLSLAPSVSERRATRCLCKAPRWGPSISRRHSVVGAQQPESVKALDKGDGG